MIGNDRALLKKSGSVVARTHGRFGDDALLRDDDTQRPPVPPGVVDPPGLGTGLPPLVWVGVDVVV